jgi:O-methyltransferase
MKAMIKSALASVGLLEPVRSVKRRMVAAGLLPWTPLVPESAFTDCACNAIRTLQSHGHKFGDYIEFGVSRGTSMACTWSALQSCGVKCRLVGFDSFEGLGTEAEENGWETGQFASTEAATRRYLKTHGVPEEQVVLVKGWFCDTATDETREKLHLSKASLFLVDSDTYESSCDALNFAAKVLDDEMVVMFDDWGWSVKAGKRGQREAFGEFMAAHPEFVSEPLPAYREEAEVFLVKRIAAPVG